MKTLKYSWVAAYHASPVLWLADYWLYLYLAWFLPMAALGMIALWLIERDQSQESLPDASASRRASMQKRLYRLACEPLPPLAQTPPLRASGRAA